MRKLPGILVFFILLLAGLSISAQNYSTEQLKPDPEKERMYLPYLATRHGGTAAIDEWKKSNTIQYYKELWYFCESFSIKRDQVQEGISIDAAMLDITRFEHHRKQHEEAIIVLPGFRDALVLLPIDKLLYKPIYQ